ncbi:EpsG family protein [Vibrio cyclitrophicus]|uniref:EpsG family protein n=1 Tax=Vibrio cyclitrophicus TaxID=47951 RepID=UPI0021C2F6F7|nr:EpsG family protein [Vibrio cyclitrophicus]
MLKENQNNLSIVLFFCLLVITPFISYGLFFLILLIYGFSVSLTEKYIITSKEISIFVGLYSAVLMALLFSSIEVSSDVEEYHRLISIYTDPNVSIFSHKGEFLFVGYIRVLSKIYNDVDFIYFLLNLTSTLLFYFLCLKICGRRAILCFLLLGFYNFFFVSGFLLRQNISLLIFSLALCYNKNIFKHIGAFFSLFFHLTTLIFLPLLINRLSKAIESNVKLVFFFILISVFSFLILNMEFLRILISMLGTLSFADNLFSRLAFFHQDLSFNSTSFSGYLFSFFIMYASYLRAKGRLDYDNRALMLFLFVSSCLYIATANIPVLPTRLGFISNYYGPIALFIVGEGSFNRFIKLRCSLFDSIVSILIIYLFLKGVQKLSLNELGLGFLSLAGDNIINFTAMKILEL